MRRYEAQKNAIFQFSITEICIDLRVDNLVEKYNTALVNREREGWGCRAA
jgi:hypothetical protein